MFGFKFRETFTLFKIENILFQAEFRVLKKNCAFA